MFNKANNLFKLQKRFVLSTRNHKIKLKVF